MSTHDTKSTPTRAEPERLPLWVYFLTPKMAVQFLCMNTVRYVVENGASKDKQWTFRFEVMSPNGEGGFLRQSVSMRMGDDTLHAAVTTFFSFCAACKGRLPPIRNVHVCIPSVRPHLPLLALVNAREAVQHILPEFKQNPQLEFDVRASDSLFREALRKYATPVDPKQLVQQFIGPFALPPPVKQTLTDKLSNMKIA